jgi:hypothetical protein
MKKILILGFMLVGALYGIGQEKKTLDAANDNSKPQFKFETEEYNFGSIKSGEEVKYDFVFTNIGNEPIIIASAIGSCGCTVPVWPKEPILKGQTGKIKVTFNSAGKMGLQDKTVTISSNAVQNPLVLHIKGMVEGSVTNVNPAAK